MWRLMLLAAALLPVFCSGQGEPVWMPTELRAPRVGGEVHPPAGRQVPLRALSAGAVGVLASHAHND